MSGHPSDGLLAGCALDSAEYRPDRYNFVLGPRGPVGGRREPTSVGEQTSMPVAGVRTDVSERADQPVSPDRASDTTEPRAPAELGRGSALLERRFGLVTLAVSLLSGVLTFVNAWHVSMWV